MVAQPPAADHGAPQPNQVPAMNLLSFLPRRRPLAVLHAGLPAPQTQAAADSDDTQHEEPPVHGCGWFDSSQDLCEGLCVREHSSPDSLARELPLTSWLELQLAGWRVTQAA